MAIGGLVSGIDFHITHRGLSASCGNGISASEAKIEEAGRRHHHHGSKKRNSARRNAKASSAAAAPLGIVPRCLENPIPASCRLGGASKRNGVRRGCRELDFDKLAVMSKLLIASIWRPGEASAYICVSAYTSRIKRNRHHRSIDKNGIQIYQRRLSRISSALIARGSQSRAEARERPRQQIGGILLQHRERNSRRSSYHIYAAYLKLYVKASSSLTGFDKACKFSFDSR